MRLIDTETMGMVLHMGEDLPAYAILSHTWGPDEPLFRDMADLPTAKQKLGFAKITAACNQALEDGLPYLWVDTVCIDKTSSAELSEAINSMFNWYKLSKVCYALLEDVSCEGEEEALVEQLRSARWFTRGWTLQELLAPRVVNFYSKEWLLFGTKKSLSLEISKVTGIDKATLTDLPLSRLSVARRMSWAAKRVTTRPEDIAYCLLGVFGVTMPLLYGEGQFRAFLRLQEEVFKSSEDHSLLAWKGPALTQYRYSGLLAPHPRCFRGCGAIVPIREFGKSPGDSITSGGLSLRAKVVPVDYERTNNMVVVVLNCRREAKLGSYVAIQARRLRIGHDNFARTEVYRVSDWDEEHQSRLQGEETTIFVRSMISQPDFECAHLVDSISIHQPRGVRPPSLGYSMAEFYPPILWSPEEQMIKASPFPDSQICGVLLYRHEEHKRPPFVVMLKGCDPLGQEKNSRDLAHVCPYNDGQDSLETLHTLWQTWRGPDPSCIPHDLGENPKGRWWILDGHISVNVFTVKDRKALGGVLEVGVEVVELDATEE